MANEGSIAPKERVNIVYRPATDGSDEEVELPLKLLVLGDFSGCAQQEMLENREPVNVTRDNFDEVIKARHAVLNLTVPDRIGGDGQELGIELKIESMKDLEPESIVQQVPQLRRLLELREALRALKGPLSNVPEFRKKLQQVLAAEESRQKLLTEIRAAEGGNDESEP